MTEGFDDTMRALGVPQDALDRTQPLAEEDPAVTLNSLRLMLADSQAHNARLRAELAGIVSEVRNAEAALDQELGEADGGRDNLFAAISVSNGVRTLTIEISRLRADLRAANAELQASAERYAVVTAERDRARAGAELLRIAAQEAHDVGREMVAEAERVHAELTTANNARALSVVYSQSLEAEISRQRPLIEVALRAADIAQAASNANGPDHERLCNEYTEAERALIEAARVYRGEPKTGEDDA